MFVGREEERLVALDRPAEREAVVLVAQFVLGRVGRRERRQRGERFVPVVVVRAAARLVRPRLDDQVDRAAGIASRLGGRLRLHRVLLDRVERQQHAGDAVDASLVDRFDVEPLIVVVGSLDLPVELVRSRSVHRRGAAAFVTREAGRQREHLAEVASVQRQILHRARGEDVGERRGRRLDGDGRGRHLNVRFDLRHVQPDRYGVDGARRHAHAADGDRLEAALRDDDRVIAQRQIGERERARRRRRRRIRKARRVVGRLDVGARQDGAGLIGDDAVDAAAEGLSAGGARDREENKKAG